MYFFIGNVRLVVLFLLNVRYEVRDVIGGNFEGKVNEVIVVMGFDNVEGGLFEFFGILDSYVEFLNDGGLDIRNFFIIFVWIFLEKEGFIFNFKRDGWGVNFWFV